MRIAIDVDGVLIDLGKYQIDYGSKYFWEKYKIGISNHRGYEVMDVFAVDLAKDYKFWTEHIYDYGVTFKARLGAKEVIDKLKSEGNEIIIMTARGGTTENTLPQDETQAMVKTWLKTNEIYYDEVLFTEEDKLEYCKKHNIDVMIEDKPRNVEMISTAIPVICYDSYYNEHIKGRNIYRAYSWYDIYTKIQGLKK